jgi:hypothetical protein
MRGVIDRRLSRVPVLGPAIAEEDIESIAPRQTAEKV